MKRYVVTLLCSLSTLSSMAQLPRPYWGLRYGSYKASYGEFEETIIRSDFYAPGSYSFTENDARNRSLLGLSILAPVAQITIRKDEAYAWSLTPWSRDRDSTGPGLDETGWGLGLDLELGLNYDRVQREPYQEFNDATDSDFSFVEINPADNTPLNYHIWLNYDYLDLTACGRLNLWLFVGGINSNWDYLIEPIQIYGLGGFALSHPVSNYGIYYKSNDLTVGIDEQVTQNMNDVLQPTTVLSTILGFGARVGRFDIAWRWRKGSDAIQTLGNSYSFRERNNLYWGRKEVTLTVYLFGGGPRNPKD